MEIGEGFHSNVTFVLQDLLQVKTGEPGASELGWLIAILGWLIAILVMIDGKEGRSPDHATVYS
ncbi:MAG: hypothetical protein OHK0037_02800 [Elainellaceae cyanobacterium]